MIVWASQVEPLPKWTGRIQQSLNAHAAPYKEVREAFETFKAPAVQVPSISSPPAPSISSPPALHSRLI